MRSGKKSKIKCIKKKNLEEEEKKRKKKRVGRGKMWHFFICITITIYQIYDDDDNLCDLSHFSRKSATL